jgi:hypothetical protein
MWITPAEHYRMLGDDPRKWYEARPELAEELAVASAIRICALVGGNLHIVHVGTAEAADMIADADGFGKGGGNGSRSWKVTGETCPQYLAFDLGDFEEQGAVLKVAPPIKSGGNADGLWRALADGGFISALRITLPERRAKKRPVISGATRRASPAPEPSFPTCSARGTWPGG